MITILGKEAEATILQAKKRLIIPSMVFVVAVIANILLVVFRGEQMSVLNVVLNAVIDCLAFIFIYFYIAVFLWPIKKMVPYFRRCQAGYVEEISGVVTKIGKVRRINRFDAIEVEIDGRNCFLLLDGAITLNEGETAHVKLIDDFIVEKEDGQK